MRILAVIPARGGSKRIPHKNRKDFCGKPILAYSVEAALESGIFDEVMVSTDCAQIARIAREYGAQTPFFRSRKTAGDFATTSDVLLEVLGEYKKRGVYFDITCCIYPTAPFVTAKRLAEAVDLLKSKKTGVVMPVAAFSYPPQRGLVKKGDGSVQFALPAYRDVRSQDLEIIYHDCGQFYAFWVLEFEKTGDMMQQKIWPVLLSELEMQDIDHETDWKLAEIKYKLGRK